MRERKALFLATRFGSKFQEMAEIIGHDGTDQKKKYSEWLAEWILLEAKQRQDGKDVMHGSGSGDNRH